VRHPRRRQRWLERRPVQLAGFHGALHGVAGLHDDTFGAVLAPVRLCLLNLDLDGGGGNLEDSLSLIEGGLLGSCEPD
jgi:hypothetical protein